MAKFSEEVLSGNVARAWAMLTERQADGSVAYKELDRIVFVDGLMLVRTDEKSHDEKGRVYLDVFGNISWNLSANFEGSSVEEIGFGDNWMYIRNQPRLGGLRSGAQYIDVPEPMMQLVEHKARVDLGMVEKVGHGTKANLILVRAKGR